MQSLAKVRRGTQGRLTAATLLASLLLLISQAFFSSPANAGTPLPACCRAHGKHFSGMNGDCSGQPATRSGVGSVHEKCPYSPLAPASVHSDPFTPSASSRRIRLRDEDRVNPALRSFTNSFRLDRSNLKRGPPSIVLL
jgi:hypothetical protein